MSDYFFSEQLEHQLAAEASELGCSVETLLLRRLGREDDVELDRLFELSPDLLCIAQGNKFKRINPAYANLLGYDQAAILDLPYASVIHPDDLAAGLQAIQSALIGQPILHYDLRIRAKDGHYVWTSWMGIYDEKTDTLLGVGRDVSEQKQRAELDIQRTAQNAATLEALVEERTYELSQTIQRLEAEIAQREAVESAKKQYEDSLKVSEDRFRGAFEFSAIGMALVSPEGKWLRVNQALIRILGYTQDELRQIDFQTITHPDDLEPDLKQVQATLRGEIEHFQLQKRYYHKNGKLVWSQLAVSLVRDADGQPSYFVSQIQDITEQKQAEEAVMRASEETQRFAYIMSHDLRAPLINLRGFSDILRKSVDEISAMSDTINPVLDEAQQKSLSTLLHERMPIALKFIGTSVDRMDQYTEAILKLSRIGRRQLRFEPVCSLTMVERILQSLAAQIEEQGIQIEVGDLPVIVADRLALDQIFANLITNAVKYLDPARPGQIRIDSESNQSEIVFHLSDNGRGIRNSEKSRIFEPFHRAPSPKNEPKTEGEGMGLAYVQALVKHHGGRIWFVSQSGNGSTFSFSVPNRQEVAVEPEDHVIQPCAASVTEG